MDLHGKHWIAGETSAHGDENFYGVDPTTGETLQPAYTEATQQEIDHAMAAATEAFRTLRTLPAATRATFLRGIATAIEDLGDGLLERAAAETGLPMARMTMERGRTCGQLRAFADQVEEGSWVDARIDHAIPDRTPIPKPDLRRMLMPMGPVVVFGASNFPLAFSVAGGDTASAIAAGCPVVVKAHPNHPGTSELVGGAIVAAAAAAGLPPGCFSLVHGRTVATGAALVQHPGAKAVGFTGSLGGGRALFDLAAQRAEPIPVYAEMGSTNPVFLLPGAMAGDGSTTLAGGISQSVQMGVGQFCTSPGLIVTLAGPAADTLVEQLGAQMAAAPAGTMLHAGIRDNYRAGLDRWRSVSGVDLIAGVPNDAEGCQAKPAVTATDAATFLANPVMAEEVFGPATLVVKCADKAELVRVAENVGGQLTATIHGADADLAAFPELIAAVQEAAGRVVFNGFPTGVEVCPSMNHGGPYPASTDSRTTSVGSAAIQRFARPVCLQGMPDALLPPELQEANPRGLLRLVDGEWTREGGSRG